jgi:hypothetical protein
MPFPMILADANCSNMNTLLTGCFSNTSQHDYQKASGNGPARWNFAETRKTAAARLLKKPILKTRKNGNEDF